MAISGHRRKSLGTHARGTPARLGWERFRIARTAQCDPHGGQKNPRTQNERLDIDFIDENIEMVPRGGLSRNAW